MRFPQAGELNRQIAIYAWHDQAVGAFDIEPKYDEGFKTWAKVEPVGAQTFYGSKQTGDGVTHRFMVRYVTGKTDPGSITGQHVIHYNRMEYRVVRVNDLDDARRFTVIEATELGKIND